MAQLKPSSKSREIMSREMAILRGPVELFTVCYAVCIRESSQLNPLELKGTGNRRASKLTLKGL